MNAIPLILMAGVGLFVFYALHASERYRAEAIRALATRSGMHYLGKALPRSLTLEGTPFHSFSKVWNVIDGEPRGTRIMAFDCQVGVGRGSWRRSVIAVARVSGRSPSGRLWKLEIQTLFSWQHEG